MPLNNTTTLGSLGTSAITAEEFGNTIAYNDGVGARIQGAAGRLTVRGNSIYANDGVVPFDIDGDGPTANDFGDNDGGVNLRMNMPVFNASLTNWNDVTGELEVVYRVLTNLSAATYPLTIDFYVESQGDGPDVFVGTDVYEAADALLIAVQASLRFRVWSPMATSLRQRPRAMGRRVSSVGKS